MEHGGLNERGRLVFDARTHPYTSLANTVPVCPPERAQAQVLESKATHGLKIELERFVEPPPPIPASPAQPTKKATPVTGMSKGRYSFLFFTDKVRAWCSNARTHVLAHKLMDH